MKVARRRMWYSVLFAIAAVAVVRSLVGKEDTTVAIPEVGKTDRAVEVVDRGSRAPVKAADSRTSAVVELVGMDPKAPQKVVQYKNSPHHSPQHSAHTEAAHSPQASDMDSSSEVVHVKATNTPQTANYTSYSSSLQAYDHNTSPHSPISNVNPITYRVYSSPPQTSSPFSVLICRFPHTALAP
jgi:hypothetical protein